MQLRLETARLCLQPSQKRDAHRIRELANDQVLANILGLPHPYELAHAKDWISIQAQQIEDGREYPLTIVSKELNDIIGTITLRIDKNHRKGELGYWIGTAYWGKGYATEAVNQMILFGFQEVELHKIWASVISRNHASSAVLKKAGLQKEGRLREDKLLHQKYEDVDVYGLLRADYGRNHKKSRTDGQ